MKKILGALAVVAMITLLAPAPAEAQAVGNVSVSIDLSGGILILTYYNTINIDIPVTELFDFATAGCTGGVDGEWVCGSLVGDPDGGTVTVTPGTVVADYNLADPLSPAVDLSQVQITLTDVWAVRSIGGAGAQSQITITPGVAAALTLAGPAAGAQIVLDGGTFEVSADDGTTWLTTAPFNDPGLVNAVIGDVRFEADFDDATVSGAYSVAGPQYTLTADNL